MYNMDRLYQVVSEKGHICEGLDTSADFVTLSPHMGMDSIEPWLAHAESRGKGAFVLNLLLAKRSPGCLEYVIIHELIHLLEKSHGAQFKKYMDGYCPAWKVIRKSLSVNIN